MRTTLVLALAAASIVGSGVAFSLHATLSPSSQSSTVADEAATDSKIDSVAVIEGEPPQDAMPAAVLRSAIEASRTDSVAPATQASPTDFYEVAEEAQKTAQPLK